METLDLKRILNELSIVRYKQYQIGIQLGIPHHKLKEFEKEGDSFSAAIHYWLMGNVEGATVSWESIVNALSSQHVDEKKLALEISSKYMKTGQKKGKLCIMK